MEDTGYELMGIPAICLKDKLSKLKKNYQQEN